MHSVNPYQAPEPFEEVPDDFPISAMGTPEYASRWRRLGGAMVDGLIGAAIIIPTVHYLRLNEVRFDQERILCLSLLGWSVFLLLHGVFIYTRGQTIGKIICGTVVVTKDFRRVSGNRYLFLRLLPFWMIGQIPFVGGLFNLADSLAIFREKKNCIHDDIAGTRVILYRDLPDRSATS